MTSHFHSNDLTRALLAHTRLKKLVARIFEGNVSQGEISRIGLEVNEQVISLLKSLQWTKESTLWKTALKMTSNTTIFNKELSGEIYRILLLSAICTRLIFSEIGAIISARKSF
jgi:hypothetical protein